jgi:hypothetical protein
MARKYRLIAWGVFFSHASRMLVMVFAIFAREGSKNHIVGAALVAVQGNHKGCPYVGPSQIENGDLRRE